MLDFLAKYLIRGYQDIDHRDVRRRYGYLGGFVAIFVNLVLFLIKSIAGFLSGSVAVTADAFNNLSDAGSGVATVLGFYYSSKPADRKHPFGHGRMEYVSALFISFMVILVGMRFMKTSVEKMVSPTEVTFSKLTVFILVISILLKGYLALFNRKLGRKIKSDIMVAAAFDSISDVIITSVVLLSLLLSRKVHFPIDGYIGGVVSLLIFIGGLKLIWETLSPILGEATDESLLQKLETTIENMDPLILGIHDMVVHDYGPGRKFVTVDVEMPDSLSLMQAHQVADRIEREVCKQFDLSLFVHVDPKNVDSTEMKVMFERLKKILEETDKILKFHDFQVHSNEGEKTIFFDLIVPYHYTDQQVEEVTAQVDREIKREICDCSTLVRIEREGVHVD